ncbi:MAG: hypothetical protein M0Q15_11160 [Nevskia sp.]|nr:hypothetical protein [Nevskia sp.]
MNQSTVIVQPSARAKRQKKPYQELDYFLDVVRANPRKAKQFIHKKSPAKASPTNRLSERPVKYTGL